MTPVGLGQIGRAVGGTVASDAADVVVRRVVTDSREVQPGDLFVAIRGERFDGHEYLAESAARGATAALTCVEVLPTWVVPPSMALVSVEDTVTALGRLAAWYRREVLGGLPTVIAVTGSNGKTTTKFMIHHVLSGQLRGSCAPKSFNNAVGVPLTLLSANAGDDYVVVEIGTSGPGEIAALSVLVAPTIGVLTSIGEAHLEKLGGVEGVAREKAALLQSLPPEGLAVVHVDHPSVLPHLHGTQAELITYGRGAGVDVRVENVETSWEGTRALLDGACRVTLGFPGKHHACNAAAAMIVARRMGIGAEETVARLESFVPPEGRARVTCVGGVTIVDDTYNANPSSMTAAMDSLVALRAGRRVFVMGQMGELGPGARALHSRVLAHGVALGLEMVVVGEDGCAVAKEFEGQVRACVSREDVAAVVRSMVEAGDAVWVKGSRLMGLEAVVRRIVAGLEEGRAGASQAGCLGKRI